MYAHAPAKAQRSLDQHIEQLVAQLDSPEPAVRAAAIQALVGMTTSDALTAIRVAAESSDANVRSLARKALAGRWSRETGGPRKLVATPGSGADTATSGKSAIESVLSAEEPPPPASNEPYDYADVSSTLFTDDGPTPRPRWVVTEEDEEEDTPETRRTAASLALGYRDNDLHRRSLPAIFALALRLCVKHAHRYLATTVAFVALLAAAVAGMDALALVVREYLTPVSGLLLWLAFLPALSLVVLVSLFTDSVFAPVVAKLVADWYLARPLSVLSAAWFCLGRLFSLVTANLALALSYLAGAGLLAAGSVLLDGYLTSKWPAYAALPPHYHLVVAMGPFTLFLVRGLVRWCYVGTVAVIEDVAGPRALARSASVSRNGFFRILVTRAIVIGTVHALRIPAAALNAPLRAWLVSLGSSLPVGLARVDDLVGYLIVAFLSPFFMVVLSLLYFDQLVRNEGLTAETLARTQRTLSTRSTAERPARTEPTYFG